MKPWQKGLTINRRRFSFKELLTFSQDKIASLTTLPWETEIYRFIITWLGDCDDILQYSSGTTGKSKEIRLSKQSLLDSAKNTCRFFNLQTGQTALLCLPVAYIAGKMMIVRCMVGELNLQIIEPTGTPDIPGIQQIDFCAMVPLQVINTLNSRHNLLPINKLIIGGAGISYELEKMLLPVTSEVYATYGMAETCSHVALRRLNGVGRQEAFQALPGVTLARDERDCLVISATYLPGQVVTNDLVEFTGPGFFKWLGRYDNLINSGGIKIVPEEIEATIMANTRRECIVIGLNDRKLGQKLVFVFEKSPIKKPVSSLKTALENGLPPHWRPKKIICVEKFPRNNSFKVDRRMLSEMISTEQT
jgi:O-succinylbenzoic acid--CoA ligase